jgi:hypothetical protein
LYWGNEGLQRETFAGSRYQKVIKDKTNRCGNRQAELARPKHDGKFLYRWFLEFNLELLQNFSSVGT